MGHLTTRCEILTSLHKRLIDLVGETDFPRYVNEFIEQGIHELEAEKALKSSFEEKTIELVGRPSDRSKWSPAMYIDCMRENEYTGQYGGDWGDLHEEVITGIHPKTKIKTNKPFYEKTLENLEENKRMKNLFAAVVSGFEKYMRDLKRTIQ